MLDRIVDTIRSWITVQDIDPGVEIVDELDDVVQSEDPVIVLFYADWCGFCRAFMPAFSERVDQLGLDAVAANISSRSDPRWSTHEIDAVPTLVAFQGGEEVARADAKPGRGLEGEDVDRLAAELQA